MVLVFFINSQDKVMVLVFFTNKCSDQF
jgi:hypothetical protein